VTLDPTRYLMMNDAGMKTQARRYSMVVQWNDRDAVCVVSLPEWEQQGGLHGHTHGATYDEAARMGEEVARAAGRERDGQGRNAATAEEVRGCTLSRPNR
jgi:hypothetical protein